MHKTYRVILFATLIGAAILTIWLIFPPQRLDLKFLGAMKPKIVEAGAMTDLQFKVKPSELEKTLDYKLTADRGWRKDSSAGYTRYFNRNRAMPTLTLTPMYEYGRAWSPGVRGTAPKPTVTGTSLSIEDPRKVADIR